MSDRNSSDTHSNQSRRLGHRIWWPWHGRGRFGWLLHPTLVGLCVGVAVFAGSLSVSAADVWVTIRLQSIPSIGGLMDFVSWFGYMPQSLVMSVLGTIMVWIVWGRWAAAWCAVTLAGASLVSSAVKLVVHRARPTTAMVNVIRTNGGYSFPSGHVLNYTVFFGLLLVFSWSLAGSTLWRTILTVPSVFMILMVGPSRIYLGAHWASDVLGAYFLAIAWLSLLSTVARNHLAGRFQFPFQTTRQHLEQGNGKVTATRVSMGRRAAIPQPSNRDARAPSRLERT